MLDPTSNTYCVSARSPYLLRDIDLMERVQYRATKLIRNIFDLPYEERLTILGLQFSTAADKEVI